MKQQAVSRSIIICITVLVAVVYTSLLSHYSGQLVQPEKLGKAYDSLAASLIEFRAEVDPKAIAWERFKVSGKTYMYFGPFPAFLRIPLNYLMPTYYGQWSRLSCLLAGLVFLWGVFRLLLMALSRNNKLSAKHRALFFAVTSLCIFLGSPLIHQFTVASLYHEPIIWAAAFSMWGLYFLCRILDEPEPELSLLTSYSICCAGALLSRVSFAVPLYGMLFLVIPFLRSTNTSIFIRGTLPAVAGGVFQLWYNYARFGSIFIFYDAPSYIAWMDMAQNIHGTAMFNLAYLPDGTWNYLVRIVDHTQNSFPFLQYVRAETVKPELYAPGYRQGTLSLILATPYLILMSLAGIFYLLRTRQKALLTCLLLLAGQSVLIMCYPYMTQRYSSEFLPFLILATALALRELSLGSSQIVKSGLFALIFLTATWSITYSTLSALDYKQSRRIIGDEDMRRIKLVHEKIGTTLRIQAP